MRTFLVRATRAHFKVDVAFNCMWRSKGKAQSGRAFVAIAFRKYFSGLPFETCWKTGLMNGWL